MILFSLLLLLAFLLAVLISASEISIVNILVLLFVDIVVVGISITACWGMANRKSYGRWLAVVVISLIILVSIFGQFVRPSDPSVESRNSMAEIVQIAIYCLYNVLLLLLILWLALSDKVAAFFARAEEPLLSSQSPPPPPTFDD